MQCLRVQGSAALVEAVTNVRVEVKLGLLSPDGQHVLMLYIAQPEPSGEPQRDYAGQGLAAGPADVLVHLWALQLDMGWRASESASSWCACTAHDTTEPSHTCTGLHVQHMQ